jgi:hypothetical protein
MRAGYHSSAGRAWLAGENPVPVEVAIWMERHANYMTANPPPQRTNPPAPRQPRKPKSPWREAGRIFIS